MKILLTGSNGFLGSILKKKLKCQKIITNDINIYGKKLDFKKSFSNFEPQKLKDVDAIIHLAGLSTNYDPPDKIYKKIAFKVNTFNTFDLAKKAKKNGIKKFIFASSASVYGDFKGKIANENSVLKPTTSYAISKKKAEEKLLKLSDKNFKVIIFRMVTLFGYSPRMRFDVLVNNIIANYIQKKAVILKSKGKLIRPQLHVLDTVQFYQQAIDNENIKSGIINIGRDEYNISILKIAKLMAKKLKCPLQIGKEDKDERSYKVSFKKQNKTFSNITFKGDLAFSFKEIFRNFKQKHNFTKYVYYNLKTLENLKNKKKIRYLLK